MSGRRGHGRRQEQPPKQNKAQANKEKSIPNTPLISSSNQPINAGSKPTVDAKISNAETSKSQDEINIGIRDYTRMLAKCTAGLVVVGAVTAVVLFLQYCVFKQADETARKAQRAFVAVREISVIALGPARLPASIQAWGPDISYRIAVNWENSGSTETRELEIQSAMTIGSGNTPQWVNDGPKFQRVLLPKATLEQGDLSTIGSDLNQVRDLLQSIFIFGAARYKDVFGGKHITLACYQLRAGAVHGRGH
jgi:hypothetical protein